METGQRIDIKPIHLKNQKPTEIRECYFELFKEYLTYKVEFLADEPIDVEDHDLGWKENVKTSIDSICLKKHIVGIDKSITADDKWRVVVISDRDMEIKVYFRSEVPAQQLFDKLKYWLTEI